MIETNILKKRSIFNYKSRVFVELHMVTAAEVGSRQRDSPSLPIMVVTLTTLSSPEALRAVGTTCDELSLT